MTTHISCVCVCALLTQDPVSGSMRRAATDASHSALAAAPAAFAGTRRTRRRTAACRVTQPSPSPGTLASLAPRTAYVGRLHNVGVTDMHFALVAIAELTHDGPPIVKNLVHVTNVHTRLT